MDYQFVIGDIIIPVGTFIVGLLVGKTYEKGKAKAKVKGDKNIVIQNSDIKK